MKINFQKMRLVNFKKFREIEIMFGETVTNIRGRNGVGKTTIGDAVTWCLFGKNLQGQTSFGLKTLDSDGEQIPNVEHSVEITLTADGVKHTLKRVLEEVWVRKRGTNEQVLKNNTTSYYVDGSCYTATDYQKFISGMITEEVFKAVTNPKYFTSLKWQEQREFLASLAGGISFGEITGGDDYYGPLEKILEQQSIEEYMKHLGYQMKQVKKKLDEIPVRLEELNNTMPDDEDWAAIEQEIKNAEAADKHYEDTISEMMAGNGDEVERKKIERDLMEVRRSISNAENIIKENLQRAQRSHDDAVRVARMKFGEITKNIADLDMKVRSYDKLMERCEDTIEECDKEAEVIRREWKENQAPFAIEDGADRCPTCGQQLPMEQIRERVEELKEKYNLRKAKRKEELTAKAVKTKELREEADKMLSDYRRDKEGDIKMLAEMKLELEKCHKELVEAERGSVPTMDEALMGDDNYTSLLAQKAKLQERLMAVGECGDVKLKIEDVRLERKNNKEKLVALTARYAKKEQIEKISERIRQIEEEKKSMMAQLSELEAGDDMARSYQERKNNVIEERVNKHFRLVRWKMFRTINNQGEPYTEPYCECYVGGVAYHDGLNSAAQLNAGLDIINTLCMYYDVCAPIVIDNAESVLNIINTSGQQVRLTVADEDMQIN